MRTYLGHPFFLAEGCPLIALIEPLLIFYSVTLSPPFPPFVCHSSRMIEIQNTMAERAIELLNLPQDRSCYLLDIGCGSGLSGDVIDEHGHVR